MVAVAALSAACQPAFGAEDVSRCGQNDLLLGRCGVAVNPDTVTIGVDVTTPGGTGSGPGPGTGTAPEPECDDLCERTKRDPFTITEADDITLSDLAAFRPRAGVQRMEPNGWMVVGLDTNIYSVGGAQVVDGTLLGQPASVRFTPRGYQWNYGDGESAYSRVAGSTWKAQRIPEFDPTPTSHVYDEAGSYTIRLRIQYGVEYRYAGSAFIPVAGTLTLPANDLRVEVGSAKTVLVERDCGVTPTGVGC